MKVYHQSVFDKWPFEDGSIQAVITSPPYYGLRKYDIPDIVIGDWKGQYGLEPTFQLYIEHTLLWCQEAKRVLRDDGVFFLNLGDSYHCKPKSNYDGKGKGLQSVNYGDGNSPMGWKHRGEAYKHNPFKDKCLLDIPFRVSIALVDNQGWIKRNNIPWYSPNKMPESVTDRFSKKHEMIFMMVKKPKYYFDLDAVKEPSFNAGKSIVLGEKSFSKGSSLGADVKMSGNSLKDTYEVPNSKNPGDVFIFNTQPSPEKHYAMWPEALVERMIKCSTKPGDIVCDPFAGSGTTLRVADKLNMEAVGIDLGYSDIQARRLSNIQKELL